MDRRFWAVRALKFVAFAALFLTLAGFITMSLWNWLVPVLFKGPLISFGQAVGLLALCKLLFGGFRGGGGPWRHRAWSGPGREMWRQKMDARLATMTEEQRARFQERFGRCAGKHFPGAVSQDQPAAPSPAA